MEYLIKLETAKSRMLESMRYQKTTFGPVAHNLGGLLRRTVDEYYVLRKRIRPEDQQEFESWFDDMHENFVRNHVLSSMKK